MHSRRAHNKAVQNNTNKEAAISWDSSLKPVRIATGHLDSVTASDAAAYAEEIDEDVKATVDDFAIHERGGDNIGYAEVEDGEFVGFEIYSQYQH